MKFVTTYLIYVVFSKALEVLCLQFFTTYFLFISYLMPNSNLFSQLKLSFLAVVVFVLICFHLFWMLLLDMYKTLCLNPRYQSRYNSSGRNVEIKLEREALEWYGLPLLRSEKEEINCNFSKMLASTSLNVKIGDHFML